MAHDMFASFDKTQQSQIILEQQATISRLERELAEAREFVVADYNSYPAYNPYAHELRRLYPWLEALAAEPSAVQSTKALLKRLAFYKEKP
jgi:hypothetical protein